MTETPRYIVKVPLKPSTFYYVWDTALDQLETTFRTITQACAWADRLNNDPAVAHFRQPLPDISKPVLRAEPIRVACRNPFATLDDLPSTFEVQASTACLENEGESEDEDPTAGFIYPMDR